MLELNRFTFKHGLLVGGLAGFVIHQLFFHQLVHNNHRTPHLTEKENVEAPKKEDCNCATDSVTEKHKLAEKYMNNQTKYDDPGLIKFMQKYILERPDPYGKLTLNRGVGRTTQAEKVLEILKNKRNGFYVEAGAFDGETASNTIFMEQKNNWTGLLVEVDPELFLTTKGKFRKAVVANACLSPKPYPTKVQLLLNLGNRQATKITMETKKNVAKKYNALCFPFYSYMLALGRTEIDYFSLDVEGLELDVLNTIPFDKLNIKVFTVEYIHSKYKKEDFPKLMESKGYKLFTELTKCNVFCRDFVFVKKDLV